MLPSRSIFESNCPYTSCDWFTIVLAVAAIVLCLSVSSFKLWLLLSRWPHHRVILHLQPPRIRNASKLRQQMLPIALSSEGYRPIVRQQTRPQHSSLSPIGQRNGRRSAEQNRSLHYRHLVVISRPPRLDVLRELSKVRKCTNVIVER